VPLVGTVTAGSPIFAYENYEDYYTFPAGEFKGDLFMLRVQGTSMIDAGIFDGDKIIVRRQNTAQNGEIVVALIDDEATVKRFYKENGHFRLQPENDYMEPIIVSEVVVLGKVVSLLRRI
jgi:repressor LexA